MQPRCNRFDTDTRQHWEYHQRCWQSLSRGCSAAQQTVPSDQDHDHKAGARKQMAEDKGKGSGPPQRHGNAAAPDWWNSLARADLPDDPAEPVPLPRHRKIRKLRKIARKPRTFRIGALAQFILLLGIMVVVAVAAMMLPPSINMTVGVIAVLAVLIGAGVLMDKRAGQTGKPVDRYHRR